MQFFVSQRKYRIKALMKDDLNSDEAKRLLEYGKDAAGDALDGRTDARLAVYGIIRGGGLEVLKMNKTELASAICSALKTNRSRSWGNRLVQLPSMEVELDAPPAQVSEAVLRELRTKVSRDAWKRVLDAALKKRGSHKNIRVRDVTEIAAQLDCLKQRSGGKAKAAAKVGVPGGDKSSKAATAKRGHTAEPEDVIQMGGDQPEASASDDTEAAGAPDRVTRILDRLRRNRVLRKTVKALLSGLDKEWDIFQDLAALGAEGRSKLLKRLDELD